MYASPFATLKLRNHWTKRDRRRPSEGKNSDAKQCLQFEAPEWSYQRCCQAFRAAVNARPAVARSTFPEKNLC